MRKRKSGRSAIVETAAAAFFAGVVATAGVFWAFAHTRAPANLEVRFPTDRVLPAQPNARQPERRSTPPAIEPTAPPEPGTSIVEADPLPELRNRHLELPVLGAVRQDLRDSFYETRGAARAHEAIDIMAARNTQVVAVEDGTIARLFESKAGGTTVYQFDPASKYAYYYAHLERYANGLREGGRVQRGQVLGYVGTSGNAPPNTPHLHFAIFRLTDQKQWWHGTAIDPYAVWK